MTYNPKSLGDTFNKSNGPFSEFETQYFPAVYSSLSLQLDKAKLSSEIDKLQYVIQNNVDLLKSVPPILDHIISSHILSLAVRYQIFMALNFITSLQSNNEAEDFFSIDYKILNTKLKSQSLRQSVISQKHIEAVKANFFPGVTEEDLVVGTIKLNSTPAVPMSYMLRSMNPNFVEDLELYDYWMTPIKDIVKYKANLGSEQFTPKFDMLTHPFVFAINCCYLHHKLFVLSLNTDSDFSYVLEKRKPKQTLEEVFPAAARILAGDISMEDYIVEFVNNYQSTFQRDKENISQILFGVHMESIRQVRAILHKRWTSYLFNYVTANLTSAISDTQNHFKELAEGSTTTSFGWS